jgi:hypothetical protein
MNLNAILDELAELGVLDSTYTRRFPLPTGASSVVLGAGRADASSPEYVVKANPQPDLIAAEATYLRAYASARLLPRLRHVDPDGRYLVYAYLPGRVQHAPPFLGSRATILARLARELISRYRPAVELVAASACGWLDEPADPRLTWQHRFLASGLGREWIGDRLPPGDFGLVQDLATISLERSSQKRAVPAPRRLRAVQLRLRGRRLSGVLDAAPVLGEPLFDLATTFTAGPGDFSLDALTPALRALANWQPTSQRALVEDVLVVLYGQTVACLIYHPADFPRYLEAWAYWRGLLRAA